MESRGEQKLENIKNVLKSIGFTLEKEQPHIQGERFLMMKDKFVLVGERERDGLRVIIKVSDNAGGKNEIESEKLARDLLKKAVFTSDHLLLPEEMYFGNLKDYMIWIMEFIPQEKVFVTHSLEKQFFLILRVFEEQESFHATTFEHLKMVSKLFPIFYAREYLDFFKEFKKSVQDNYHEKSLEQTFVNAEQFLISNKSLIDQYCNHLTHTDFVPHNFRVNKRNIYMLDLVPNASTVHFGNKYEGWARLVNYMVIHHPELQNLLSKYILDNRGEKDYLNLRLMRVYKIGYLLKYYAESLKKTSGDLRKLTLERISFWHEILKYILDDKEIPTGFVEKYKQKRDNLRSEDEKKRQKEFAIA